MRVQFRELAPELTHSLTFTHAQRSGRFSAQTRSQQQQIPHRWEVEQPGAARCSRQGQEVTYYLNFCVCRALKASSAPPHSFMVKPAGDPLLCSHIDFSWISTGIILGGRAEKVRKNCRAFHSDICVRTCTSSGDNPDNVEFSNFGC